MHKAKRRQQVLDAAKEIFAIKGFHKTSISEIVKSAGIARGTLYLYFRNKRRLFHSILEFLLHELDQRIKPIELGEGNPPPIEQLRANLTRVITFSLEEPQLIRILFHSAVGMDKEFERELHALYEKVADRIERALELGIKMSLVRPCPTRLIAYGILGGIKEVMAQLASSRISALDVKVVVDGLFEVGIRGVLVEPVRA